MSRVGKFKNFLRYSVFFFFFSKTGSCNVLSVTKFWTYRISLLPKHLKFSFSNHVEKCNFPLGKWFFPNFLTGPTFFSIANLSVLENFFSFGEIKKKLFSNLSDFLANFPEKKTKTPRILFDVFDNLTSKCSWYLKHISQEN